MSEDAKRVTLYTSPGCPWCGVARTYLREHAIEFSEVDISEDRQGLRDMVLMTAQHGVPVLLVGSKTMVGWNAEEFERLFRA